MAEIDGDVIGDVAPNDRICGNSRILDADVYAGAFKHEPHDAEYVRLACTPAISSRNTRGANVSKRSQTPLRLGKTDHSGFAFRQTNQFGPKRPVSKADLAERRPVHMSARRRDVRHRFEKLGYGFRCTQRWESIMGWPFTTAWATIFVAFLAHIGRANDVPPDAVTSSSGASRAVQQPASVVSTPAPNERMSASDAPPSVTAVKADTWIVPDTSTHCRIMNGARPSVSAGN